MSKKIWVIVAVVVVTGGAIAGMQVYKNKNNHSTMNMGNMTMPTQSKSMYKLNLMSMPASDSSYAVSQPTQLTFDVRDQNNKVFKDFAIDYTKLVHLIVVRKDRTNFQHVHPTYDSNTGMFSISDFQFPADGEYRIFANFTPTGAKKEGMVESEAPYQDVKVGDMSTYVPQKLGEDSLISTVNGFTASITQVPGGDSVGSLSPTFYAAQDTSATVSITKDGQPFKKLQEYLGSLGHMVVLGPNLEFIHAHPMLDDINNQTGFIQYMVNFPVSGQYKLYLQTQADNQVTTNDFNVTVQSLPKTSGSNGSNSMSGMSH